ncbi:MAG: phosphatidylglycerol lysyltransferase domain-containing protein, partial [Armatimonadota bacterium]
ALNAAGWRVEWKEDEYLYAPRDSLSLRGTRMRTFRRHVNAFTSRFDFECEAYSESHREECLALLRAWRKTQGRKHRFLLDVGYTKAALDLCGTLPPEDLFGEVVMVNGRVVAFAFAGRMSEDLANFFVAKADPALDGLSYFLRWRMFRRLSEYGRVNDAGDLGHPGLAQFKRSLRPVEMLPVFRARRVSIE